MTAIASAAVVVAATCACSLLAGSTYFDFGNAVGESGPVAPGAIALVGMPGIDVKPGDSVRFDRVSLSGMDMASVTALIAPLSETNGQYAVASTGEIPAHYLSFYEPLSRSLHSSAEGSIGIIIEFPMPNRDLALTDFSLTFTVNGAPESTESVPLKVHVCADASGSPCSLPDPAQ